MNLVEGYSEVGGQGVGGGDGVLADLDLDCAVAAGCLDDLADGPAGLVLDPAADRQRSGADPLPHTGPASAPPGRVV